MSAVCGNPNCGVSKGVHDDESTSLSGLTFGSGELDFHGYWEFACFVCARAFERENPTARPCWPFEKEMRPVFEQKAATKFAS